MIILRTIECIGYDPNKKTVDFKILLPLLLIYKLIHYQIAKQYEKNEMTLITVIHLIKLEWTHRQFTLKARCNKETCI